MKILYFSRNYTPHDFRFLNSLSKTDHEIFYLKLEAAERQTEDRPVPENVRQVLWTGGRREFRWSDLPRLVFDFCRIVREINPDLVHAGPIQTCAFIAVLSGFRPILTKSWGYDLIWDAERNGWMKRITRYVLRRSACFIGDSNVIREKAIAYGMEPGRIVLFPWGVNIQRFHPGRNKVGGKAQADPKSSIARRKSLTLFCSRAWEPIYGVDVLAEAFVKVAGSNPRVNLILLGGGSQGTKIRQILTSGGVMDRVHFGGQVGQRDLPRWYHMADIYISPSHVDGTSISLLEGLACGLPCLVSDIPGNREWIEEGVNGWLFKDGDVNDLAERILAAGKNRKSFKKIGEAARKTAEDRADWSRNFGKLLEAYTVIAREQ